ncbi:sigma-54-dependent Fis family transcriptional regulator [Tumebacillus avium]|uniref:Sigma-54-dependent Fis family transcriptional regulator n=1 Tax=Tumebacillus avium TaxID=1903704 RepID=A0A1Y0ITL7_9BACL|nr:sigma 54-interacting transcriptional regulator [Tumebacillus avium]ARU63650.1 sigma-54-dependent Fis family transcriptional regulator [Tumebacillus avium]
MQISKNGWVKRYLDALAQEVEQSRKELFLYKAALNQAYEGIIITDKEGRIVLANQTYANFLNMTLEEMIGRPVTEMVENTRMHLVARTGKAEIAHLQRINGQVMIANRIPVFTGDEVTAVIGKVIFQDIRELFEMTAKFERLNTDPDHHKKELNKRLRAKYSFDTILGASAAMERAKKLARRAAQSDSTVLLQGESGTGKELFAHAIHQASRRGKGPLIRINCAAIPESLFESELFGYTEGSFTGAKKSGKKGKFALADQGTLFLDEVSELPLQLQVKLLRALQEREIEPVGADAPESVDVRIIAASNKDLAALVAEGRFRQDLFYRLHVVPVDVPPLREREGDVGLLLHSLLRELIAETGIPCTGLAPEAEAKLLAYDWPGNVRELRNVLERALHVQEEGVITLHDLPADIAAAKPAPTTLKEALDAYEEQFIRQALQATHGDKLAAATRLGISKSSLYAKLDKYNLAT